MAASRCRITAENLIVRRHRLSDVRGNRDARTERSEKKVSFPLLLFIAVGLAMDAFSVAVGVGATLPRMTWRHVFRLAWHFGLFQFLMPIAGWAAGETVASRIGRWDHWIAFGLLAFIGVRMIYSSLKPGGCAGREGIADPTCGITLISLSIATSLDALAVGFSLAAIGVGVLYPAAVIGLVAAILTSSGMFAGRAIGSAFGRRVGIVGGLVLVGVGVKILSDHLAR